MNNQDIYYSDLKNSWKILKNALPKNIKKVASISTKKGLFCIGSINNNTDTVTKIFLIQYINKEIIIDWEIPPPSFALLKPQLIEFNNDIFILVNSSVDSIAELWKLKLSYNKWEKVQSFKFKSNKNLLLSSQSDGIKKNIFVLGGERLDENYKFDLELNKLTLISSPILNYNINFFNSRIFSIGTNHLIIFHKNKHILAYHTITDSWINIGKIPFNYESENNPNIVKTKKDFLFFDNINNKKKNITAWLAKPIKHTRFGLIDYIILFSYLILLIIIGLLISRKKKTVDDFFRAGKKIPWWAAGLSIFATQLSAITFMAIPAKSYSGNWTWVTLNLTIILIAPFIGYFFIPLYSRLNITTAYEYIEKRFNLLIRIISSSMFIIFQLVRLGTLLYLPSIALSAASGMNINFCILLMGFLAITYTVIGGIEAVIWTDVIQVFVLLGGAILALYIININLENGLQDIISIGLDNEKFKIFNFHFNFDSPTFWVLCLGGIGSNIISYGTDQSVIQRYLTTKNHKEAQKSIFTNAYLTIPSTIIFFSLGTSLYSFYKIFPNKINIHLENIDGVFPWFISSNLPQGISGLLIAGIFAATMSSLDSGMNSVATVVTTDFFKRFKNNISENSSLFVARITTMLIGFFGIILALAMSKWEIDSLWTEFTKYIGLFGGGLGGLFILAIFTRKANSYGVLIGLVSSAIIQYILTIYNFIHPLMYAFTGLFSCFTIGYISSILINPKFKADKKLTSYFNT